MRTRHDVARIARGRNRLIARAPLLPSPFHLSLSLLFSYRVQCNNSRCRGKCLPDREKGLLKMARPRIRGGRQTQTPPRQKIYSSRNMFERARARPAFYWMAAGGKGQMLVVNGLYGYPKWYQTRFPSRSRLRDKEPRRIPPEISETARTNGGTKCIAGFLSIFFFFTHDLRGGEGGREESFSLAAGTHYRFYTFVSTFDGRIICPCRTQSF